MHVQVPIITLVVHSSCAHVRQSGTQDFQMTNFPPSAVVDASAKAALKPPS